MAISLINRSGTASNVTAVLRARAPSAVADDPYVTLLTSTINYGELGPFNTVDNGLIYSSDGIITGVARPFVFRVATNCPNDHVIPFELTVTYRDGWDPSNPVIYANISYFSYVVQRGKNVPTVISSNFTLTADQFWIVGGPVLVESGATLTVEPGTQVQWGALSSDPVQSWPTERLFGCSR